jgi:hypothetical protein
MTDVTHLLNALEQGDPQAASRLLPLVYDELRKLAARRMAWGGPGGPCSTTRSTRRTSDRSDMTRGSR